VVADDDLIILTRILIIMMIDAVSTCSVIEVLLRQTFIPRYYHNRISMFKLIELLVRKIGMF